MHKDPKPLRWTAALSVMALLVTGTATGIAKEHWIAPQGVYSTGLTKKSSKSPAEIGRLMATEEHEDSPHIVENGNALLENARGATATLIPHSAPAYVILDMGKMANGYPRLILNSRDETTIDLGWSERLTDGHVRADDSNHAARYSSHKGLQAWRMPDRLVFRYLELRFAPSNAPVQFRLDVIESTIPDT